MNFIVEITFLKSGIHMLYMFINAQKREGHLFTFQSGSSKTKVDYCLVSRNQRKCLKGINVLPT